jgi:hypothetical protein
MAWFKYKKWKNGSDTVIRPVARMGKCLLGPRPSFPGFQAIGKQRQPADSQRDPFAVNAGL